MGRNGKTKRRPKEAIWPVLYGGPADGGMVTKDYGPADLPPHYNVEMQVEITRDGRTDWRLVHVYQPMGDNPQVCSRCSSPHLQVSHVTYIYESWSLSQK